MSRLALQLGVPMAAVASIPSRKVGEECWNSSLDGLLEAVPTSIQMEAVVANIHLEVAMAARSEAAHLQETLPMASWVVGLYKYPIT
jgi:hypothetical protein